MKNHRKAAYVNLLTSGKLNIYIADIDQTAEKVFSRLMVQMVNAEGITEKLKADDMMYWVDRLNSIRSRATDLVNAEIIYC